MFGLAVIVPAVLVFYLTYRNAANLASASEAETLRVVNKGYALAVFERLNIARSTLERISQGVERASGTATGSMFTAVTELGAAAAPESGSPALPDELLLIRRTRSGLPEIAVIASNQDTGRRRLQGTLAPDFLWGDPEAAISNGRICVQAEGIDLTCVGSAPSVLDDQVLRDQWDLVLKPEYGVGAWRFLAVRRKHDSFSEYAGLLLPLAVGMLLTALLLSSIEIRRILVPLETLLEKIAALGGGRAPSVSGDDEFVMLHQTFHSLQSRITGQILALKTLQEIDQLILARSPLGGVIELVLKRIRTMVGARPIAISVSSAVGDFSEQDFLLRPDGVLSTVSLRGGPAGDERRPSRMRPHDWQEAKAIAPGLAEFGLASVWCLTVGQDSGPLVRVSLGQLQAEAGENLPARYNGHGELEELAGRVAVALAAEAHEQRLVHQARHDLLTDLPNRLAVFELLPGIIGQAQQSMHGFATLFVDLDRFKAINDGLGHTLGDTVLVEVARRLRSAAGPDTLVARLGGDEFFVVAPYARDRAAAIAMDDAIREAFEEPLVVENNSLFIGLSSGIAMYPTDGEDADMLMRNADLAMYRAKQLGGASAMPFDAEMNQAAEKRVQLEHDLRLAMELDQLHLHYQPRIDSRDGSIVGAEALLRWTHPVAGNIGPGEFIGLAEECGLIGAIGALVLDRACRQLAAWQAAGLDLPMLAVNVSPHQLRAGDLFDSIAKALATHGLDWSQLEIEITESVLVKDSVFASEQLQRLREAGCTVAIDDFGTGYSSLAYLANLPTDTIKIDRSFIGSLHARDTQAVVRSIIALGQTLGKTIVAEGVESSEQVKLLNSWDCHIVQGFVYFPPLPPESLAALLPRIRDAGA
ncbi:EAL domain-containing protein [Pseudoxanthomonas gei]|uniref:EAL domain-containing protein n=1 Tax=Pseudoxanthomonas gei TaxID=1383030 RepID=A0ABX0AFV6_9GAMM|nr:EAL domain-containing protein [Pseudoxanthomonas gei]NDK39045.1 EAL domain-containing protein [Pseudoxanthomonas gei]